MVCLTDQPINCLPSQSSRKRKSRPRWKVRRRRPAAFANIWYSMTLITINESKSSWSLYQDVGETAFMSKFATSNLNPKRDTKPLLLSLLPLLLLLLVPPNEPLSLVLLSIDDDFLPPALLCSCPNTWLNPKALLCSHILSFWSLGSGSLIK